MQANGDQGHRHQGDHPHQAELHVAHRDHFSPHIAANAQGLAARNHEHDVFKHHQQTEGGKNLHVRFVVQGLDDQALDRHAEQAHRRRDQKHRHIRAHAPLAVGVITAVHAQHDQLALGEVDDAHHAKDQVQADADQAINAPQQQAEHQHIDQITHESLSSHEPRVRPGHGCGLAQPCTSKFASRPGQFAQLHAGQHRVVGIDGDHLAALPLRGGDPGTHVLHVLVELGTVARGI